MVYIRGIRGISGQHNIIHTRMFFRTRIGLIGRIFLGCDIVYIRLIRGISGQHNIIHTRIYFFSNTNRTNRTNLLSCDMVYIRGIREIRGQEPAASGNACKSV